MAWHDHATSDRGPVVHDVVAEFAQGELAPGGSVEARLTPLAPEFWPDLARGARFDFWEPGARTVAWAEVIEPLERAASGRTE
jgi:hypothetical protein